MKSGEIQRAIHVLREHTADSDHVVAVIETATFLLRGGLHDQALGLVSGTEPFIEHPAEAMGALGEFFAAATEAGLGQRFLARFTSPRWPGRDPQVASLARAFGGKSREVDVPPLDLADFADTVVFSLSSPVGVHLPEPDQLVEQVMVLQELDLGSELARQIFDAAGAVAFHPSLDYVVVFQLALLADEARRPLDTLAFLDALSRLPERICPGMEEIDLALVKAANYMDLGAMRDAAACLLLDTAGADADTALRRYSQVLRRLLRSDEFDAALYLVSPTQEIVDAGEGSPWWRLQGASAVAQWVASAADPGFGELWPSARGRLKNAFTEYVESGAADGLGSQYVGNVVTALQKTQRAAEAVDLSSWALPVAAKTQNPRETLFTLCDNAVSLFCCERFEESALVLESVHQRAREAGDAEAMGWAVNYLRDFGVFSGLPAYAQALERLR